MTIDPSRVRFLDEKDGLREARLITGDLGEYIERIFAAAVPDDWTFDQAQQAINELIEPEHCHHDHDCCGRFYGGIATVISQHGWCSEPDTNIIWIKRLYSQNV